MLEKLTVDEVNYLSEDEFVARFGSLYEHLTTLNREYREKFRFPLVIAVRGHTKETILADAAARLQHSRSEEIETALSEIAKIAYLRLQDLVEPAPDEAAGAEGAR